MIYDIRLFSKSLDVAPLPMLRAAVDDCRLEVVAGDETNWNELLVTSLGGDEICILERCSRRLMRAEIDNLSDELADCRPRNSAQWVDSYLASSAALYGCRDLAFSQVSAFAAMPYHLLWAIQEIIGSGILHTDGQGFSNEEGYQITWEFSDQARGTRQMAVLGDQGRWHPFEMDLSNRQHRAAFKAGERPSGADVFEFH